LSQVGAAPTSPGGAGRPARPLPRSGLRRRLLAVVAGRRGVPEGEGPCQGGAADSLRPRSRPGLRRVAGAQRLTRGGGAGRAGNAGRAGEVLAGCPPELRQWEWHYLRRLFRSLQTASLEGHPDGVLAVDVSPDGSRIASAGADGVTVWDRTSLRTTHRLRVP